MRLKSLSDRVSQAKARWLKRVMQDPRCTAQEKNFAYVVLDLLNCVTLDCWPSQVTVAQRLGGKCTRTVKRAADGLAQKALLSITRNTAAARNSLRYAPVFRAGDFDRAVPTSGQPRPPGRDIPVRESSLEICLESSSTAGDVAGSDRKASVIYHRGRRGSIEIELASALGSDGIDILAKLSSIDDAVVDRLCQAFASGQVGVPELAAARLAAEQARTR